MPVLLKYLLWTIFAIVVVVAFVVIVCDILVVRNAKGSIYSDVGDVPECEVGLLLGTTPRTRIGDRVNTFYTHRIEAATELYKAGKIKKILVSGADRGPEGIDETICMRDSLVAHGVPASACILDGKGYRTFDSVIRARKVFGFRSFMIISQRFHNERALYIADHTGLDVLDVIAFDAKDAISDTAFLVYLREYLARVKMFVDIIII